MVPLIQSVDDRITMAGITANVGTQREVTLPPLKGIRRELPGGVFAGGKAARVRGGGQHQAVDCRPKRKDRKPWRIQWVNLRGIFTGWRIARQAILLLRFMASSSGSFV